GWNSRLDEVQAAVLRIKLRHLDESNAARARLADFYNKGLLETGLLLPAVREDASHVYHLYVVRTRDRDRLIEFLRSRSIGAAVHYPVPVHLQPAYARLDHRSLPETESAAREVLSLPMYPELTETEANFVIEALKEVA
ncbi:MAG: DegT/DnrJ/EryC1/StrS family aminotransferase, partial [Planctomycetota bacterium]